MIKSNKSIHIIILLICTIGTIYVGNYIYIIAPPQGYYKRILFPYLYFNIEESKYHPNIYVHYQDFGAFGSRLFKFIKNEHGYFRINRDIPYFLNNDSIYFNVKRPFSYSTEVSYGWWWHLEINNRTQRKSSYPDELAHHDVLLNDRTFYKFEENQFQKVDTLVNYHLDFNQLDTGFYFLSYPGFFYDTLIYLKDLR